MQTVSDWLRINTAWTCAGQQSVIFTHLRQEPGDRSSLLCPASLTLLSIFLVLWTVFMAVSLPSVSVFTWLTPLLHVSHLVQGHSRVLGCSDDPGLLKDSFYIFLGVGVWTHLLWGCHSLHCRPNLLLYSNSHRYLSQPIFCVFF